MKHLLAAGPLRDAADRLERRRGRVQASEIDRREIDVALTHRRRTVTQEPLDAEGGRSARRKVRRSARADDVWRDALRLEARDPLHAPHP